MSIKNVAFDEEELIKLLHNTIRTKTKYKIEDYTGGSLQITSTHNHTITNYKVSLFFGYNSNRNAISYTENINKEVFDIWAKALMLKAESMKTLNCGMDYHEIVRLMKLKPDKKNIRDDTS